MPETEQEVVLKPNSLNDFARERGEMSRDELVGLYSLALSRFWQSVQPPQKPPLHGVIDYLPHEFIED